jgi:hypothetical protein
VFGDADIGLHVEEFRVLLIVLLGSHSLHFLPRVGCLCK